VKEKKFILGKEGETILQVLAKNRLIKAKEERGLKPRKQTFDCTKKVVCISKGKKVSAIQEERKST